MPANVIPGSSTMTVHVCTIIARNYIAAARALGESIRETNPSATFHTLVIDDVHGLVDDSDEPFDVLRLEDIGFSKAEIHRFASIYTIMEFATAVKPWLLSHLQDTWREPVIYLDPDILVYRPLDDISKLATQKHIVLTPHVTRPIPRDNNQVDETGILSSGIYNLGFITVGPETSEFLDFWKIRLRRECISDIRNMRFVDQRWVDFIPGMFETVILRDTTYNVAYWNLAERNFQKAGAEYLVDGHPLHFFHFSGYDPTVPELLSKYQGNKARVLLSENPALVSICNEYRDRLLANDYEATIKMQYPFTRLQNGLKLDHDLRRLYREALIESEQDGSEEPPNPIDDPDGFTTWLNSPGKGQRLPRYLSYLYDLRADLRAHFPGAKGSGYRQMLDWAAHEAAEGRLNELLVPPNTSARNERSGEVPSAPSEVPKRPEAGIRIAGYFTTENGVGELGRLAVSAVEASGIPYSTLTDVSSEARQNHSFVSNSDRDFNVNLVCVNADVLPQFAKEMGAGFFDHHYTIGLWAWELEEFPDFFSEAFAYVDEIWALSSFAREAISKQTNKPVHAFPVPITAPAATPQPSAHDARSRKRFTFLFCFDLDSIFKRKNPLGLITAYLDAFQQEDGAQLVIKALNGSRHLSDIERLKLLTRDRHDIKILDEYLDADENRALMASCDCYVSLHRSEGLGLTIAEAMSLGKPVIATNYSGNLDFMTEDTSYGVTYSAGEVPEGCDPYPVGARWAEPNLSHAAQLMRHVFSHPEEARAIGERARTHIIERHSPSASAPFIRERFDAIEAKLQEQPPSSSPADFEGAQTPPALIAMAMQRPRVDGPSRFPRLAKLTRKVVRRLLVSHDVHQNDMNMALAMGTEHLARISSEMQAKVSQLDEAKTTAEAQLKDLNSTVRKLAVQSENLALEATTNSERIESIRKSQSLHASRVSRQADVLESLAEQLSDMSMYLREQLQSIPYMSEPYTFLMKNGSGNEVLGYETPVDSRDGYASFEDIFRGPESLIRKRQEFYRQFVNPERQVVDIGCGRGEFLDILQSADITAIGVDSDPSMVTRAATNGHVVANEDAVGFLRTQDDCSISTIFTAQMIEHLQYNELVDLIHESSRTICDGGVLIMETVNPYSMPAFRTFWTDLTHQKPIFPEVLLAITQASGFSRARVVFPNGTENLEFDRWHEGEFAVIAYR